jgi:hypothetical protein
MIQKLLTSLGWRRKKPLIRKSSEHKGLWVCSSKDGLLVVGETPQQAYAWWEYWQKANRFKSFLRKT